MVARRSSLNMKSFHGPPVAVGGLVEGPVELSLADLERLDKSGAVTKSGFIQGYLTDSKVRRKCINPPPLFDVNEFPGPIKKTAAYVSRKLERKTVPEPPRRPENTICALDPRQRFALFVSDSSDPVSFAGRAFTTGWSQFWNDEPKLGQGTKGYAKRYGVATMDQFSKGVFTTFLYPSISKEDPRYYRMGKGPFQIRLIHAMSHVIVAHKNSGHAVKLFRVVWGDNLGCARKPVSSR
jgi:hypothetical protein